jgi:hypothetical protein
LKYRPADAPLVGGGGTFGYHRPLLKSWFQLRTIFWRAIDSVDTLTRLGATIWTKQKDFLATRSRCDNHAFTCSKFHFARGKVGDANHKSPDQLFRVVGRLDSSENGTLLFATEAKGELEQFTSVRNFLCIQYAGNPQIDFCKVIDGDFSGEWFVGERWRIIGR